MGRSGEVRLLFLWAPKFRGRAPVFYYRRGGKVQRLHGEPGSPAFLAEYHRIHESFEVPDKPRAAKGSVSALVEAYLSSPEFAQLAPTTQRAYRDHLDGLRRRVGDQRAEEMPRRFVAGCRDRMRSKPRTANMFVAVVSLLFSWGIEHELVTRNPAKDVRRLKSEGKGYRAWTGEEIAAVEALERPEITLAVRVALGTGLRRGDLVRVPWSAYDGVSVATVAGKTGAQLWIPCHPDLKAALDAAPRRATTILTTAGGLPWKESHLSHAIADAVKAAGLKGVTLHGLRTTAATRLAEAGCTDSEIAAITGHASLAMVAHYRRGADQKIRATAAIAKLERKRGEHTPNGN